MSSGSAAAAAAAAGPLDMMPTIGHSRGKHATQGPILDPMHESLYFSLNFSKFHLNDIGDKEIPT
ncbi:conserved hypothetical protein [Ricinus communis]|uniref:Uncharacterized protein n=1 Tax=Ricinus communis TaxID=3988 RepID=B9T7J2_RICCO|nr:conserved hypothetical protein [Ricinus communis]